MELIMEVLMEGCLQMILIKKNQKTQNAVTNFLNK